MTQLYQAYAGFKFCLTFKGGHNTTRPNAIIDEAVKFVVNGQKSYQMITTPKGDKKLPSFSFEARRQLNKSHSEVQEDLEKTIKKTFVVPNSKVMEKLIVT